MMVVVSDQYQLLRVGDQMQHCDLSTSQGYGPGEVDQDPYIVGIVAAHRVWTALVSCALQHGHYSTCKQPTHDRKISDAIIRV